MSGRKLAEEYKPIKIISISVWEILFYRFTGNVFTADGASEYNGSAAVSLDLLKIKSISRGSLKYLQPYLKFRNSRTLSSDAIINVSFESLSQLDAKTINKFKIDPKFKPDDEDLKKLYSKFLLMYYINNPHKKGAPKNINAQRVKQYEYWYKDQNQKWLEDKDQDVLDRYFTSYVIKQMRYKFMDLMKYYLVHKCTTALKRTKNDKKCNAKKEEKPRLLLYKEGFDAVLSGRKIHYCYYKRSASKAKQGDCIFITEDLHERMMNWTWLGLKIDEKKKSDLTSAKAYDALVMSSIIGTVKIPRLSILMLDSAESGKISGNRKILVKDGKESAKLISEDEYKKTMGKEFEHHNILWDGQALLDSSFFTGEFSGHGMMLLRNSFFKACAFNTNIQKFFKDNGIKEVTDMFGRKMKASDVRMIVTVDSLKLIKFAEVLGKTDKDLYVYWLRHIDETFGVVKQEEPSNLGNGKYHEANYQILNTLPLTTDDIRCLVQDDARYMALLKTDKSVMLYHLRFVDQSMRKKYFIKNMLKYSPDFDKTDYYRAFVQEEISDYKEKMRNGRIKLRGDLYTLCSMPYEMLEYAAGKKVCDISPQLESDEIYISGINSGKELPLFRNPHMNSGSVCVMKTRDCPVYDEYFNFATKTGSNIVVVSPASSNIMVKLGGADFDSDTVLILQDETILKAAKELSKMDFLFAGGDEIPVAQADESIREGTKQDLPDDIGYAMNDGELSQSAVTIGTVSNTVQYFNSIFWDGYFNNASEDFLSEVYDCILYLSILNELEIDKSKHEITVKIEDCRKDTLKRELQGKTLVPYLKNSTAMYVPAFLYKTHAKRNLLREKCRYWKCPVDQIAVVLSKFARSGRTQGVTHKDLMELFDLDREGIKNTAKLNELRLKIPRLIQKHQAINKDKTLDDMDKTKERNEALEEFLYSIREMNDATMSQLFKYAFDRYKPGYKDKNLVGKLKYPELAGNDVKYMYLGLLFAIGRKVATDKDGVYHEDEDPAIACIKKDGTVTPELRLLAEGEETGSRKTVTIWGDTYVYQDNA